MAELGMMGMNIPAEYGGSQTGVVSYSLAMTEIGKACASTAVTMSVTNMVAEVIQAFGKEEHRLLYIPRICGGEYPGRSLCLDRIHGWVRPFLHEIYCGADRR